MGRKSKPKFVSGAAIDTRSDEEKKKDHKFVEIVAAANPVTWVEKTQDQWRKFPIFNQDGSGSCVAQTEAKELGILRWLKDNVYVHFSASDIYQRRSNKPGTGMIAVDARNIARDGVTLEVLAPSQNLSDTQMDAQSIEPYKRDVGKIFSVPNYLELPVKDIETIASVIQTTGKGVMVWFYWKIDEWTEHPVVKYPDLQLADPVSSKHSVTAVDFALVNGKKCLIIEDSWGSSFGMAGQRVIDEDFFKARNWYAGYLMSFKFDTQALPKPVHLFSAELDFGQTNDDIKALQDILKYEGFFPTNTQSTGFFGSITAKGLLQWQIKHNVAPLDELNQLAGRRAGPKTIEILNSIYGQ